MKNGAIRFDIYLTQLSVLLTDAAKQPDPALRLYGNGARTPLFMLEGLAKLYRDMHDSGKFKRIGRHFKMIEDAIGAIDYYDSIAKEFRNDPLVPKEVTGFAEQKAADSCQRANTLLTENDWLEQTDSRISKIRSKLASVDWQKPKDEIRSIKRVYKKNIEEINEFWSEFTGEFTDVETQIHSLRRKLRWLSIYPQAVRGCIQLTDEIEPDPSIDKYLTAEIVNSPFNKMPGRGANRHTLVLDRGSFLALSWLIAELGKLKDDGLRMTLKAEANRAAGTVVDDEVGALSTVLTKAHEVCKAYFTEGHLDQLVAGTASARI